MNPSTFHSFYRRKEPLMAGGWSRDGAVQDQIDDTVKDAVLAARARLAAAAGDGETHCVECGEEIPEARRRAMPGAKTCVACQSGRDARIPAAGINRRGSKDSQLR
jgi:phage/conjugal plasmid C-4 type zinc finger TraR family protein